MPNKNYNILITGSNGQLGSEIRELSSNYSYTFFFTDRTNIDITSKDSISSFCQTNNINIIINCAAYTAVDKAESDELNADLVNRKAVKKLALVSSELNIKLIHISTDYVFDGRNFKPYCEEFQTNPQGVYGKTKLDGENEMRDINPKNSIIIRTSWVYSSFGNNFVKTMLKLGRERDELNVIFDQVGTPTYAGDLAEAILKIISSEKIISGIYHFSNEGVCSWYDFTKTIHRIAGITCNVKPIESKDFPAKVTRPHYSVLNKAKIKSVYSIEIPYWEDSLEKCIDILK